MSPEISPVAETHEGRAPMDLLRFATAGSVDDGKSTLIGRLLLDSKSIFEDQLEAVEATVAVQGLRLHRPGAADRRPALRARAGHHHRRGLPLLRDARAASSSSPTPRATSSTPATWSPAPRPPTSAWCWSTPARASPSSRRRHAVLLSLLRVPHLVLAVNKMDLVDWDEDGLREDPQGVHRVRDEAEHPGPRGHPDLGAPGRQRGDAQREHAVVPRPHADAPPRARPRRLRPRPRQDVRFPVQYVVRPKSDEYHDYRGYGGMVAGGVLKPGDEVVVLPSGMTSKIAGHRPLRQGDRRGVPAHVGHRPPRGRRRRLPRRHDRPGQQRARSPARTSTR